MDRFARAASLMENFAWITPLAKEIGATATALALLCGVLFYFYRRDHIVKQGDVKEERQTLMQVVVQSTQAYDKLTGAVDMLSTTVRQQADAYTRNMESIIKAFEKRK